MPKTQWNLDHRVNMLERNTIRKTPTCWHWLGAVSKNGYSKSFMDYKTTTGHRVFYTYYKGVVPEGLQIDHLCRNKLCVNPEHLEAVTSRENIIRGTGFAAKNSKKKKCLRRHLLSGDNLYITPDGRRQCKKCRYKSAKLSHQRRVSCQPCQ